MNAADKADVTRRDLCALLHISRSTAHRWEVAGYLPRPVHVGPRAVRWIRSEVEAFLRRLAEDRGGRP